MAIKELVSKTYELGQAAMDSIELLQRGFIYNNLRMLDDMSWLIHEMTHVWQFQMRGWVYLIEALWAQLKLGGAAAYNYGGQAGLEAASLTDASIHNFNPEQQGDIAKHYFRLLKLRRNTEAWEPFVEDIRRSRK